MKKNHFRLLYSRLRGMLVAVAETARGTGKSDSGETTSPRPAGRISLFSMWHAVFAALMLFGVAPSLVDAQVTAAGAHATVFDPDREWTAAGQHQPAWRGRSFPEYLFAVRCPAGWRDPEQLARDRTDAAGGPDQWQSELRAGPVGADHPEPGQQQFGQPV